MQDRGMGLKENLTYYMELKGVSAAQLARTSSTPKQRISAWLTGKTARNLNHLKRVADTLDVTVDDLLFRTPVKSGRTMSTGPICIPARPR